MNQVYLYTQNEKEGHLDEKENYYDFYHRDLFDTHGLSQVITMYFIQYLRLFTTIKA